MGKKVDCLKRTVALVQLNYQRYKTWWAGTVVAASN